MMSDIILGPLVHMAHTHMNMHTHKHTVHTNNKAGIVRTVLPLTAVCTYCHFMASHVKMLPVIIALGRQKQGHYNF